MVYRALPQKSLAGLLLGATLCSLRLCGYFLEQIINHKGSESTEKTCLRLLRQSKSIELES